MGTKRFLKDSPNVFMTLRIREKAEKSHDVIKLDEKVPLHFRTYPAPCKLGTCAYYNIRH